MLLNVGFGLTIAIALLLLLVAVGYSWYNDHLSPVGSVNGQSISKDAFRKQVAINDFRADYQNRRIRTLLTAGHLRTADAQARQAVLDQRNQQKATISLEQLIDGAVMAQLATSKNVTVADADVDARLAEDATTPELRHAWMIAVAPELAEGETKATDAEKAAAKAKADQALADLRAGKDWETVAKAVSTDGTKNQGGDIGYIDENAALDPPFVEAVMAAALNATTDVIEGADGTYRIGRVTDIVAPVVDATYLDQVKDAGIDLSDYREALRRDVLRTKLSDAVVAQYLAPGPQREVSEIHLGVDVDPSTGSPTGKESDPTAVKIRHILYSPAGDAQAAASLAPDDAAWKAAEEKANAAYQKLKADPSLFASLVASDSDDGGSSSRGGSYWFTPDDPLLPEFQEAIFKPGLTPGQLLEPVKTDAGWHVIQIQHFPTDLEWANTLKQQIDAGTLTFADAARDNSDTWDASTAGDEQWILKGQLSPEVEAALFAAPIGKLSSPLAVEGDGVYLFLVSQEQNRAPDAEQKASLESSAFPTWYSTQKGAYAIERDPEITASGASG
ncbi:MAG TPA: peptidylprolyl isomerase [Candidatus Limnocylindrales bacterium]